MKSDLSAMRAEFNRIGLGTVQLGLPYGISNKQGKPSEQCAKEILDTALFFGITLLDTAVVYGTSHQVIGQNQPDRFHIVSKWEREPMSQLDEALQQLKVPQLYGWMAHRPQLLLQNLEYWTYMQEQKESGRVKKIGYSLYSPDQLDALLDKGIYPDVIQVPYNALDNRFKPYFGKLSEMGCEIHCRSIFLQGLFFVAPQFLPSFFDPIREWLMQVDDAIPDKIKKMSAIIHQVLSIPGISRLIIGVESSQQLIDLSNALENLPLPLPPKPNISEEIINPSLWPITK